MLRHSAGPWIKAAGVAESLQAGMGAAKGRLTTAHDGVSGALRGLACAAALEAVLASWEERIGAVGDECGALAPALRGVAEEQRERDVRVKSSLDALSPHGPGGPGGPVPGPRVDFRPSDGAVPSGSSTP
ncbi:hypothetical protein ABZ990_30455 [Streptomyces sp. NPDC046203]|uniref:hypothetical protein n=1 Tax=Streptomyces sp. NPDC046203 TaxID=3154602 RepID=UPI0033D37E07